MLKFASYNIHKGVGTDRRRNPERIVSVLNEIDADVIALQEADLRFGKRDAVIAPMLLDQHSDYKALPLDVQADSMGWHGNTILVRKQAEIVTHDILHIPFLEPRGAIMARIIHKDMTFGVFGMHLDLSGLWRRRQAAAILALAEKTCADDPVIMMGDLNEWSAGGGCLRVFAQKFRFADCGRSFHVRRPVAQLDRIMYSREWRLLDSGVHMSAAARKASDHFPIWAEVERV